MQSFDAIPKRWGNSLGVTIPREVIQKGKITPKRRVRFLVLSDEMEEVRKAFGTLTLRKPTQQVMDELDDGYD